MKKDTLRAQQSICKAQYQTEPSAAIQRLTAVGQLDFENLSVHLIQPSFLNPAGLHTGGGGDGTFACPVEIMLAGLVSCAGVTLTAVATSMQLNIRSGRVVADGMIDFRGTLAVERSAPVGLTAIRLRFELDSDEEAGKLDKLIELTHRYCVVHRTLDQPPPVEITRTSI